MGMTFFSCPNCKASLGSSTGFTKKLYTLGPPVMRCGKCGTSIRTGAQEWPDLPRSKQRSLWFQYRVLIPFILGPISIPMIGGLACCPLSFINIVILLPNPVFFTIAGIVGVVGGIWFAVSEYRNFPVAVAESIARWEAVPRVDLPSEPIALPPPPQLGHGERMCLHCRTKYKHADYDRGAATWLCSACKQPLPKEA